MLQADDHTILEQQGCSYLTLNVVDCIDIFIRPVYKQVIVESLNYFIDKKGLTVYAWCLMTNHLHLIASARESYKLSNILRDMKEHTAKEVIRLIEEEPASGFAESEFLLNMPQ